MKYKLLISIKAQQDLEAIYEYIKKDNLSSAIKLINLIYNSLENLQFFPEIGVNLSNYTIENNNYKFLIIKKKFIVFYIIDNKEIKVIRIFRTEQDYIKILGIN